MNMQDFIPAARVAEMLGFSPKSKSSALSDAANNGKIPGAIKVGRDWFLPVVWVEEKKAELDRRAAEGKPKMGRPKKKIED